MRLDGRPVRLADFVAAVDGDAPVTVAPEVRARLAAARLVVEAHAAGAAPVYGLNTGLGANLGHRIAPGDIAGTQHELLAGRHVGTGPALPERTARAALLARAIGVARGHSGLSPVLIDLMAAMLTARLAPVLPAWGSIGASDLALSAALGFTLLGEGDVLERGTPVPAREALARAGLVPAALAAKDAMALANASCVTVALAVLSLDRARRLLRLAMAVAALAGEGYAMNLGILDSRLHALRPAAGQEAAAAWLRAAFAGSALTAPGAARYVQDALSFRCLAPLFGAALASLRAAEREAWVELNAASDSPAVIGAEMLSTPNFHTHALALAADALAVALAHAAGAGAQRLVKLMAAGLSGLPRGLSLHGGASAGFVPMQKTAAALMGEIRHAANPASLDAMAVSEMVEDIAPQTPLAFAKLGRLLDAWEPLVAIEAMVAAQAVDLRGRPRLGPAGTALHLAVRGAVVPLDRDRATGPDIERTLEAISRAEVLAALPPLPEG